MVYQRQTIWFSIMFAVRLTTYLLAQSVVYERRNNGVTIADKTRPHGLNARGHALALQQRQGSATTTFTGTSGRQFFTQDATCVQDATQPDQLLAGQDVPPTLCLCTFV